MTERREAIRDAREQRRDEWQMRDPTELEANLALTTVQNRIDHCNLCDGYGAVFGRSGEEERDTWQQWYEDTFDAELPHVIENLGPDHIWEHWNPPPPPGNPCCYPENLGPVPPLPFQWQVDAINEIHDCPNAQATVHAVVMKGEEQKAALKERIAALKEKFKK